MGFLTCFGKKEEEPKPAVQTKALAEQAKRISQDAARSSTDNDEFLLRVQGFGDDDPEIQKIKEAREQRRSQDMEARAQKEKDDEEAYRRRLQGM
jgi:hypothetical protein